MNAEFKKINDLTLDSLGEEMADLTDDEVGVSEIREENEHQIKKRFEKRKIRFRGFVEVDFKKS